MIKLQPIKLHISFPRAKVKRFAAILLLLGVMSCSLFNLTQKTSATTCNPNSYTVKIFDQSVTGLSEVPLVESVSNPHFRLFISSVRDHVLSKFAGAIPCQENLGNKPMINLVFVRLPLVLSGNQPSATVPSLDILPFDVTCRLDSPWAKLAIRRSKLPLVRAVFMWNERQFLLDQALMSSVQVSATEPAKPIDERIFEQFVNDYTDSVLLAPSPEAESAAQASIAKRLPAEILWLFRHAWQSTLAPFSMEVDHALGSTVQGVATGYTDLTKTLVNQCFVSAKTEIRYKSVLDIKNVFTLDKYRINRLH